MGKFRVKNLKKLGSSIGSLSYEPLIPTSIFHDRELSFAETIIEYLHEQQKLKFSEIAALLNRDERNIWTLYRRANEKRSGEELKKVFASNNIFIPVSVFQDRSLSILEVVVEHLKAQNLPNAEIARLLLRSEKTIWQVASRVKEKRRGK